MRFYFQTMSSGTAFLVFLTSVYALAHPAKKEERYVKDFLSLPSKWEQIQEVQSLRASKEEILPPLNQKLSDFNREFIVERLLPENLPPEVQMGLLNLVEEFHLDSPNIQKGMLGLVGVQTSFHVKKKALQLLERTPVHEGIHSSLKDLVRAKSRPVHIRKAALVLLGNLPHPPADFHQVLMDVVQEPSHKFVGSETNNLFYLKSVSVSFMHHIHDPVLFFQLLEGAFLTPNNYVKDAALYSLEQNPPSFLNHYNHPELQRVLAASLRKETNINYHKRIFEILGKATEIHPSVQEALVAIIQDTNYSFFSRVHALSFLPRLPLSLQISMVQLVLSNIESFKLVEAMLKAFGTIPLTSGSLYTHPPTLKMLVEQVFFTARKKALKVEMLKVLLKACSLVGSLVVTSNFQAQTIQLISSSETNPYLKEALISFIPYFDNLDHQTSAILAALKSRNFYINRKIIRTLAYDFKKIPLSVYNEEDIQKHLVMVAFFEDTYSIQQAALRALQHVSKTHPEVEAVLTKAKDQHRDIQKKRTAADILNRLKSSSQKLCKNTFS